MNKIYNETNINNIIIIQLYSYTYNLFTGKWKPVKYTTPLNYVVCYAIDIMYNKSKINWIQKYIILLLLTKIKKNGQVGTALLYTIRIYIVICHCNGCIFTKNDSERRRYVSLVYLNK